MEEFFQDYVHFIEIINAPSKLKKKNPLKVKIIKYTQIPGENNTNNKLENL